MRRRHRSRGSAASRRGARPPGALPDATLGRRPSIASAAGAEPLSEAGLREPPSLIVEGPEGARPPSRARRARRRRAWRTRAGGCSTSGSRSSWPRWSSPCSALDRVRALQPFRARIASSAAASRNSQPMASASSSKSKRGLWCGWSRPRAGVGGAHEHEAARAPLEVDRHVLAAHGGLGRHHACPRPPRAPPRAARARPPRDR